MKLKQVFALFLLMALSWQMLFKTGYLVYWKINQINITERYCVNKDKPKMHCNGKCHLAKQLQKVEEVKQEKSKFSDKIVKIKSTDSFVIQENDYTCKRIFLYRKNKNIRFTSLFLLSNGYLKAICQPPEFI